MNKFDSVLNNEKKREYALENKDLMAFATLTQIAHEDAQTQIKQRFKFAIVFCVISVFLFLQIINVSSSDFTALINKVTSVIDQYPYAISIANLCLVGVVLAVRRVRLF